MLLSVSYFICDVSYCVCGQSTLQGSIHLKRVNYLLKNSGKYNSDHQLQSAYSSVFVVIEKCYVYYVLICYN